jgi:hypothetical protein
MADVLRQTSEVVMRLDPSALENMVKEQLRVQVAAVFAGSAPALVEKIIQETLDYKVNEEGRRSNYSGENTHTFLSAVCRNSIKEAVSDAVNEWRTENKDKIKAAVKKHLTKHKDNFLEKFADQTAEAIGRSTVYPSQVSVYFKDKD